MELFGGTIHSALIHAATDFDRRQGPKANPYALGQYFQRIAEVEADITKGIPIREALLAAFNGRLLDKLLVAVGEPKFTHDEMHRQSYTYHGTP
jgi:hypothetical protein